MAGLECKMTIDMSEAMQDIGVLKEELKELVELYEKLITLQGKVNIPISYPPYNPNPYDQYPPYDPHPNDPYTWGESITYPTYKCLHVTVSNEKKVDDDG